MSHEAGPLETATTEELLHELYRRFDAAIVLTTRDVPGDPGSERFELFRSGTFTECFGLLHRGKTTLDEQDGEIDRVEDDGPGDDAEGDQT